MDGVVEPVTNELITESCGILNKLLPVDLVLADDSFDIEDSVGLFYVHR